MIAAASYANSLESPIALKVATMRPSFADAHVATLEHSVGSMTADSCKVFRYSSGRGSGHCVDRGGGDVAGKQRGDLGHEEYAGSKSLRPRRKCIGWRA